MWPRQDWFFLFVICFIVVCYLFDIAHGKFVKSALIAAARAEKDKELCHSEAPEFDAPATLFSVRAMNGKCHDVVFHTLPHNFPDQCGSGVTVSTRSSVGCGQRGEAAGPVAEGLVDKKGADCSAPPTHKLNSSSPSTRVTRHTMMHAK